MRIIVFSGKGGSGVTTLAAATAAGAAAAGRTLAFALAPGLRRALGAPASPESAQVTPSLAALEANPGEGDEFRSWLIDLLDWRGIETALAEDLAALPGLNYAGRLLHLERCIAPGDFDTVVVDGGPLEHFLDLPAALDAAARWLERFFGPRQQNVFEPFFRVFAAEYASAGDDVLERGRHLLGRLARLRGLLADPEVSSARIVLRAEPYAAPEARSAVAVLALYSCPVDAVVVNRLLPDSPGDAFARARLARQQSALSEIRSSLSPLPVLGLPLQPGDPRGVEELRALSGPLYAGREPAAILRPASRHSFERREGHYVLSLPLPFARREEMRLEQLEDAIAVQLNGRRCLLPLPVEARYHEATSWSLEGDVLRVTLEL